MERPVDSKSGKKALILFCVLTLDWPEILKHFLIIYKPAREEQKVPFPP
jgi:hypothetical protein